MTPKRRCGKKTKRSRKEGSQTHRKLQSLRVFQHEGRFQPRKALTSQPASSAEICVTCWCSVAARAAIYKSLRARSARNRKKSQKESFWGSARKSPRIPENVKKYQKTFQFWGILLTLLDVLGDFLQTPEKTLFETFWRFRARRVRRLLYESAVAFPRRVLYVHRLCSSYASLS